VGSRTPADLVFDQMAKPLTLFIDDGGTQVLDLDESSADEYDQGELGKIANQPRIQKR
jgi:hypothetical protein